MRKLIEELTYPESTARPFRFRIGKTLASALAGFIVGGFGVAFFFWYILKAILPAYCP